MNRSLENKRLKGCCSLPRIAGSGLQITIQTDGVDASMTTFNTNYTGNLGARTHVGPTKIRSPTRYSDMFIGVEEDTIDNMMETGR